MDAVSRATRTQASICNTQPCVRPGMCPEYIETLLEAVRKRSSCEPRRLAQSPVLSLGPRADAPCPVAPARTQGTRAVVLRRGGGREGRPAPPRGCLFLRRRSPKPRLSPTESRAARPAPRAPLSPDADAGPRSPQPGSGADGAGAGRGAHPRRLNGRIEAGGGGGEQILKPELVPGPASSTCGGRGERGGRADGRRWCRPGQCPGRPAAEQVGPSRPPAPPPPAHSSSSAGTAAQSESPFLRGPSHPRQPLGSLCSTRNLKECDTVFSKIWGTGANGYRSRSPAWRLPGRPGGSPRG